MDTPFDYLYGAPVLRVSERPCRWPYHKRTFKSCIRIGSASAEVVEAAKPGLLPVTHPCRIITRITAIARLTTRSRLEVTPTRSSRSTHGLDESGRSIALHAHAFEESGFWGLLLDHVARLPRAA